MSTRWRWARARSIGTSHLKSRLPCQDHVACLSTSADDVFFAVVSDGAGTASHASDGSRLACAGFLDRARRHCANEGRISDISTDTVYEWMDDIRERINTFARRTHVSPRACAATLIGLVAGPDDALVVHVGDGAAVIRESGSGEWRVASWPTHGEYASTTFFVTDDPAPLVRVVPLPMSLDRVALFSDGLERMVLDHSRQTAHVPFFEKMTTAVAMSAVSAGHDRRLSALLRSYLDSDAVTERTDDDKSLVLGARA